MYPTLPKTREEVHEALQSMVTITSKDEQFVLENNTETAIVRLSCSSNHEFMAYSVDEIFVDETFKCCPRYFYQLYNSWI